MRPSLRLGKLRANSLNAVEWSFLFLVSVHIQGYILCVLECTQSLSEPPFS